MSKKSGNFISGATQHIVSFPQKTGFKEKTLCDAGLEMRLDIGGVDLLQKSMPLSAPIPFNREIINIGG